MTSNIEVILGKTNDKGIEEFKEDLRRFASEHTVLSMTTTVIQSNTFQERIVATIIYAE